MKKLLLKLYNISEKIVFRYGFGKFKLVKKGGRWVRFILKTDFVELDGHKMFLDPRDILSLSTRKSYEEFETKLVKKIIKEGDVVIDIGGNIGYFTLIFAKLVGENGQVFVFEPEPNSYKILKKNVEINGYNNVKLINKAVSNEPKKVKLYLDDSNLGGHSLANRNNKKSIEIDAIKLDEFLGSKGKINFIKMDVEGAEIEAIKGMSDLLKKMDDLKMLIEFNPKMLKGFGVTTEEYFNELTKHKFKIYDLDNKNERLIQIKSYHDLAKYKDNHYTNLLCSKKEE